jgi:hypothetical protein
MSTQTMTQTLDTVSQGVFVAGNANLAAPEVRRNVADFIINGGSVDEILTSTRQLVVNAMTNRGDSADTESVDKKFLTNGYQRPIYLGALIATGVDAEIAAAFTKVDWTDIKPLVGNPDAVDILSAKAAAANEKAKALKAAKEAAAASLASTTPAFKSALEKSLGADMDQEAKNLLFPIYLLLKGSFSE